MSIRKAVRARVAGVVAFGLFVLFGPLVSGTFAQTGDIAPGVSKDAAAALARLSKTLQAEEFSFMSRTLRAYVGPNGELLHVAHKTKMVFHRPDHLLIDATGDDGSIKILYDGKMIVLYGVEQNKYATFAVSGDLDQALDLVEDRTGTDLPLADFLSNDPASSLLVNVTAGGQVGTATIDGVRCLHLYFVQTPDMEFELWLEDNDRALPRRVVVTYRGLPGRPRFFAELSDWNFTVQPPDSAFEFNPPAGAVKVELSRRAQAGPAPSR